MVQQCRVPAHYCIRVKCDDVDLGLLLALRASFLIDAMRLRLLLLALQGVEVEELQRAAETHSETDRFLLPALCVSYQFECIFKFYSELLGEFES